MGSISGGREVSKMCAKVVGARLAGLNDRSNLDRTGQRPYGEPAPRVALGPRKRDIHVGATQGA